MRFPTVTLDPPWDFKTYSPGGGSKAPKYPVLDIKAIARLPVLDVLEPDAVVLVWVTDPILDFLPQVIAGWNERARTKKERLRNKTVGFYWTKQKPSGAEHVGGGYWTRANPEQCWLYTRGNPNRINNSVRKWIHAPVGIHSEKPLDVFTRTEALVDGPYLEVFARPTSPGFKRPGWTYLGNEINGQDIRDSLPALAAA
jgi:N6-adenosine-specific RNA methylase IME4